MRKKQDFEDWGRDCKPTPFVQQDVFPWIHVWAVVLCLDIFFIWFFSSWKLIKHVFQNIFQYNSSPFSRILSFFCFSRLLRSIHCFFSTLTHTALLQRCFQYFHLLIYTFAHMIILSNGEHQYMIQFKETCYIISNSTFIIISKSYFLKIPNKFFIHFIFHVFYNR